MAKMKKMAMGGMGQPLTQAMQSTRASTPAGQPTPVAPTRSGLPLDASEMAAKADAQARMGPPPTGLRRPAAQPVPKAMSTAGRAMGRNMGSETEGGGGGMGFRKEMMDQMRNRKPSPQPQQAPVGVGLGAMAKGATGGNPAELAKLRTMAQQAGALGGQSSAASPQMEAARTAQAANQQASMMKNLGALGGAPSAQYNPQVKMGMKKGGAVKKAAAKKAAPVKKMASGGMTSSASRRGDGIASKGKTRGKIC